MRFPKSMLYSTFGLSDVIPLDKWRRICRDTQNCPVGVVLVRWGVGWGGCWSSSTGQKCLIPSTVNAERALCILYPDCYGSGLRGQSQGFSVFGFSSRFGCVRSQPTHCPNHPAVLFHKCFLNPVSLVGWEQHEDEILCGFMPWGRNKREKEGRLTFCCTPARWQMVSWVA